MQTKNVLQTLFDTALEFISPDYLIKNQCKVQDDTLVVNAQEYKLLEYEHIYLLGSGKAAWSMAKALSSLLSQYLSSGVIVSPVCQEELEKIECLSSDHPIPSERSLKGAQALITSCKMHQENDLYIYLLSGGSSSLIELPVEGVSLEAFQMTTDVMLKNALNIEEINTVRKHLSSIKGGRLAQFSKAQGLVLCISDVIGDDLYSIGSAPLYADTSSYEDALAILKSYQIEDKVPSSVRNYLEEGVANLHLETPKKVSKKVHHELIGSNFLAKEAVYKKAQSLGLDAVMIEGYIDSDVNEAVDKILELALNSPHKVIIFGGEVTVKVEGEGQGGRNQHAVLCMLKRVKEQNLRLSFLSAGTDGIDGNSDAAGAYIDTQTLEQVEALGLDIDSYLKANDSYHFFKALDNLIMRGPTGTNVMDIMILIKE